MNPFDEISDRLAALGCLKPLRMHTTCGCKATREHPLGLREGSAEVYMKDDVLQILCEVEQEYNLAMNLPTSFDPSWQESIADTCRKGEPFRVSGSADFISMVRRVAGSYGYTIDEWGSAEYHASLWPPKTKPEAE